MKITLIDQASGAMLYVCDDFRIISALKTVVLDSNIIHLFPRRHSEFYGKINLDFVSQNSLILRAERLEVKDSLRPGVQAKKELAAHKADVIKVCYNCADVVLDQSNFYVNSNVFSIMQNIQSDEELFDEYVSVRNLSKEESYKEILLKNRQMMINAVKVQASVDKFIEQIEYINTDLELQLFKEKVILSFFKTL